MSGYSERQLRLYRAYSAKYDGDSRARQVRLAIDTALAVSGIALAMSDWTWTATATNWLGLAAFIWLAVREIALFATASARHGDAVRIQEMFDLSFHGEPLTELWNSLRCGPQPAAHEVRLAATGRQDALDNDYWVDTHGLEDDTAALLRVHQSAAWGQEEHRLQALVATWGAAIVASVAVAVAFVAGVDVRAAVADVWLPAAPLLVGLAQSARAHRELADRRNRLRAHTQSLLLAGDPTIEVWRTAQDFLYDLRAAPARPSSWLYRQTKDKNRQIDAAVHQLATRLRNR